MWKKYILIGLVVSVFMVFFVYERSIFPLRLDNGDPKYASLINQDKKIQTGETGKENLVRPKQEAVPLNINKKDKEGDEASPQSSEDRQHSPMPMHVEGHIPVDLNEFLEAREARRKRFAENYDEIINASLINREREKSLELQAMQALEQVKGFANAELESINCSDRICRMTLAADSEESHVELRKMSAGIGILIGSDAWTYSDTAQRVSYVYISPPGEKLPNMKEK